MKRRIGTGYGTAADADFKGMVTLSVLGSEIDFLIQNEMSIVPIEVKAEVNLQAKSLKFYCLKFKPPVAVRTSMGKYYKQTISFPETSDVHASGGYALIDLPLYGISRIQQECAMISDK